MGASQFSQMGHLGRVLARAALVDDIIRARRDHERRTSKPAALVAMSPESYCYLCIPDAVVKPYGLPDKIMGLEIKIVDELPEGMVIVG